MQVSTLAIWLNRIQSSPPIAAYLEALNALHASYIELKKKPQTKEAPTLDGVWKRADRANRHAWSEFQESTFPLHNWLMAPDEFAQTKALASLYAPDWGRCDELVESARSKITQLRNQAAVTLRLLREINTEATETPDLSIVLRGDTEPHDLATLAKRAEQWDDLLTHLWGTPKGMALPRPKLLRVREGSTIFDISIDELFQKCIETITSAVKLAASYIDLITAKQKTLAAIAERHQEADDHVAEIQSHLDDVQTRLAKAQAKKAEAEADEAKWAAEERRIDVIQKKLQVAIEIREAQSRARKLQIEEIEMIREEQERVKDESLAKAIRECAQLLGADPEQTSKIKIATRFIPKFLDDGGIVTLSALEPGPLNSDDNNAVAALNGPVIPEPKALSAALNEPDDSHQA